GGLCDQRADAPPWLTLNRNCSCPRPFFLGCLIVTWIVVVMACRSHCNRKLCAQRKGAEKKKAPTRRIINDVGAFKVAVAEGFEPSVRGCRTKHFECFTFGRSDTLPCVYTRLSIPDRVLKSQNQRLLAKKWRKSSPHSSAKTPATTSTWWLSRGSLKTSSTDPAAPVFGSQAPKTTRGSRDNTIAPAHIEHGSIVTASVQSASSHSESFNAFTALAMAIISACLVGSPDWRVAFTPVETSRPSGEKMAAPIGTS